MQKKKGLAKEQQPIKTECQNKPKKSKLLDLIAER